MFPLMQPQTMMLPPPCLTVGKAQFYWYFQPVRRHQCWGKLLLKVMHYNIALLPKKVTNYVT